LLVEVGELIENLAGFLEFLSGERVILTGNSTAGFCHQTLTSSNAEYAAIWGDRAEVIGVCGVVGGFDLRLVIWSRRLLCLGLERLQQAQNCDRPDRHPGSEAKPANSSRVYHEITLRLGALKRYLA
jgi:hypothetical protein